MRSFLGLLLVAAPLQAMSPTGLKHSWVAGTGDAGGQDGAFMVASFNEPCGILHDAVHERLLVADRGNGRLRSVWLGERNRTDSLDLKSAAGGAFAFVSPQALTWIEPDKSFYCLDVGRPGLARVDLASGSAEWLSLSGTSRAATRLPRWGGMLAFADGGLLFSDQDEPSLSYLEPLSHTVTTVVLQGLPGPGLADLGAQGDELFGVVRRPDTPELYRIPEGLKGALTALAPSTSTAATLTLSLSPYGAAAPSHPWAFVKAAGGALKLACDDIAPLAYRNPDGSFSVWHLFDPWARLIGDGRHMLTYAWDPSDLQVAGTTEQHQPLRFLRRPAWVCEDAREDRWYVSDSAANRIVGVRRTDPETRGDQTGTNGLWEESYAQKAAPGTYRIGVIAPSYFLSVKDLHLRSRSFTKRFEWYLNFFSSLRNGPRFEVMLFNISFGESGSSLGWLRARQSLMWGAYGVDEVLLCNNPRRMLSVVQPYRASALDEKGLPSGERDPEFFLKDVHHPEAWKDPAYQRLGAYLRETASRHSNALQWQPGLGIMANENPDVSEPFYTQDLADESYLKALFGFYADYLRRLKPELEASAAAVHKPLRVTALLAPEYYSVGYQERDSADLRMPSLGLFRRYFAQWCQEAGLRSIDMVDELRTYAYDWGNLGVMDREHLTADGTDLVALIAAQLYLKQFGADLGLSPEK
jgi:hypothetical protein